MQVDGSQGWQAAANSFLNSSIWVCDWCFGGSRSSATQRGCQSLGDDPSIVAGDSFSWHQSVSTACQSCEPSQFPSRAFGTASNFHMTRRDYRAALRSMTMNRPPAYPRGRLAVDSRRPILTNPLFFVGSACSSCVRGPCGRVMSQIPFSLLWGANET